jgi:hypothetical protein
MHGLLSVKSFDFSVRSISSHPSTALNPGSRSRASVTAAYVWSPVPNRYTLAFITGRLPAVKLAVSAKNVEITVSTKGGSASGLVVIVRLAAE